MKQKIYFPLAITFIILCAVLLILVILQYGLIPGLKLPTCCLGESSEESSKQPSEQSSNQITEDETSNWNTYRNEEYGFEIEYHNSVSVYERKGYVQFTPQGEVYEQSHPRTFLVISAKRVDEQKTLDDLLKEDWEFYPFIDEIKKDVSIEGLQGYLVYFLSPAYGTFYGHCYYIVKKGDIFIDIERGDWGLEFSSCGEDLDFNQMISTFRFIE